MTAATDGQQHCDTSQDASELWVCLLLMLQPILHSCYTVHTHTHTEILGRRNNPDGVLQLQERCWMLLVYRGEGFVFGTRLRLSDISG